MKIQRSAICSSLSLLALLAGSQRRAAACDLCAINSATTDRSQASGFVLTLGEQYISAHTSQYQSEVIEVPDPEYLDSSITHMIPGYNFTPDLGLNLNVPIVRRDFRTYDAVTGNFSNGRAQGLGDISLITRWTPWSQQTTTRSFRMNLLAGIKMPTGDTRYVRDDVAQHKTLDAIYGTGHDHAFNAVHLHDIALGSGSVDALFGLTATARYKRVFVSTEAQYYLRTEGESNFQFGDTVMIAGDAGAYVILRKNFTLNLQAVARYENTESASYSGIPSSQTGMREIYAGPQVTLTASRHFSAQVGGDIPIDIRNKGFQVVPDYRVHGALTWSF
jgi:hypothetical protein